MHAVTEDPAQANLKGTMTRMIGLLLGTLLTGILLTLGISSLFLLASRRGDRNLLRRNRFLRAYIIILLMTMVLFDTGVFVGVDSIALFFYRPQDTLQKFIEIWGKVMGTTTLFAILWADGVLVRLS